MCKEKNAFQGFPIEYVAEQHYSLSNLYLTNETLYG
jgi:hypothetical protein